MLLKKTKFVILLLISLKNFGQTAITFPMEKSVFQRNVSNLGSLYISGTSTSTFDLVEARLINPTNETVVVNWTTIQSNPNFKHFNGVLSNVPGGWYRLEVRGKFGGVQVDNIATINRVGVGEVFLIAGQSNAQGIEGYQGEVGATNERVVSHNYNGTLCNNIYPDYPSFTQIFSDGGTTRSYLSKTSPNPWVYGKLGDNLVSRLGVPVVYFNAGATASSSLNWQESSDGAATNSHYSNAQYCSSIGMPYNNLQKIINYYASTFGVRAILWHQGETDNYANMPYSNYIFNLNSVINKSRESLGSNVSWVVAKASVWNKNLNSGAGNPNSSIITAQQDIVNNTNKIFSGPSTDDILGSQRSDEVHFYGSGLIEVANRWDAALDNTFFSNATPIMPKTHPMLSVTCAGTSQLILSAPSGYNSYKWVRIDTGNTDFEDVTEATSQSITRSSGTYRCYLTDSNGNITFTGSYIVQDVVSLCSCTSLTYLSNLTPISSQNGWGPIEFDKSNGEAAANDGLTITLNGTTYNKGIGVNSYSEAIFNLNGNYGRFITDIGVDDEVNGNNCNGGTVVFEVYKDNILAYQSPVMNTNSPTIKLNLKVSGTNQLKIVVNDAGDGFCADHADWAGARLHCVDTQAPTAPSALVSSNVGQNCLRLSWSGSTDNMEVDKYFIYRNGTLIDSVASNVFIYNVSGLQSATNYNFAVKAKDYSGNLSSNSNTIYINTLSNIIILAGLETINIGQSTTLSSGNCNGTVSWSTGQTTASITVSPSDTTTYAAVCITNGCTSSTSNLVKINVIPNCKTNYNFISAANNFANPTINYIFSASNIITATNSITNRSRIEYKAAKSITLNPGFQASGSAVFKASISGCPN